MPTVRLIVLIVCAALGGMACSEPIPRGIAGPDADGLARRMMQSVDADAWKRTKAISWRHADRRSHLWDRRRQLARVQKGDLDIYLDLRTRTGVVLRDGVRLQGQERDDALREGYEVWANDSFWLTAMNKAFDPGTTRSRVSLVDGDALLVQYASGGVTPGDAYLWHLDEDGRPQSWQMWVSILPIGGVSVTWEEWTQLPTGAWVSTKRDAGLITIEITELDAAETMSELVKGPDPFDALQL
jgi:hypothetical protein